MNLANGKKVGLMMGQAKKPSLKKRGRLILLYPKLHGKLPAILRAKLRAKLREKLRCANLPCLRLAQARLSGLQLFALKPFMRLAKMRALMTGRDRLQGQLHYHLYQDADKRDRQGMGQHRVLKILKHLGDNPLGGNRLGDNPLGGNRLGGNRLGENRLGDNPHRVTHHVRHDAMQKLASLNMAKILHGGDNSKQDTLPKLRAHMGLVRVRDASDAAENPDASRDNDAPLRADSQYIDRVIRQIISVKTHKAGNHQQMMGRVADDGGQHYTEQHYAGGRHHGGRHHAAENMRGQQAQSVDSLQQIVRQEINPLKAELESLVRGQQTIIAETVQQYQAQHAEDGFFSDATHKADMWHY